MGGGRTDVRGDKKAHYEYAFSQGSLSAVFLSESPHFFCLEGAPREEQLKLKVEL